MRPFLIGAAGGAALGGGAVYAYIQRRGDESPASSKPASMESAESHPAMRMGWPTGTEDTLRVRSGFVASFDARTRNPRWVLEVINSDTVSGPGNRRRSDFVEDAETPASFRPKLSDYRGSGYDRGHLAAAAGHKDSQRAMDETFELINVSPQVGDGFNRDYWARLERFTRELSGKSGGDVLVATGPLFLPTKARGAGELRARELEASTRGVDVGTDGALTTVNGALTTVPKEDVARPKTAWRMDYGLLGDAPELVAVPTHFFKVILATSPGGTKAVAAAAFVLPNAPIAPNTPLGKFAVPLGKLEAASGLSFFRNGALGGSRRGEFEREEADYLGARAITSGGGDSRENTARDTENTSAVGKKLARTTHVCKVTHCVLPRDEYAKGGSKYKPGKRLNT